MNLYGGSSQLWIQAVILVAAIILKVHKTEYVRSHMLLSLSVLLVVCSIAIPPLSILFVSPRGSSLQVISQSLAMSGEVLAAISVLFLWMSIARKR